MCHSRIHGLAIMVGWYIVESAVHVPKEKRLSYWRKLRIPQFTKQRRLDMESVMVTKVFTFCAAHRLYGYIGECHHIHGHNYRVAVTITRLASQLDASGMVLDFKVISSSLGKWIDKNLDHTILVSSEDTELKYLLECMEDSRYFLMDNPTAENIAKRIFQVAADLLPSHCTCVKVVVHETDTCYAEVSI
jgi:6-pyruvoyltetrahydropterin/6-carboxytetrahydropterin synthase